MARLNAFSDPVAWKPRRYLSVRKVRAAARTAGVTKIVANKMSESARGTETNGSTEASQATPSKWTLPLSVIGALFVIFQFFATHYEERIQRSLDRVKDFNVQLAYSARYVDDYLKRSFNEPDKRVSAEEAQVAALSAMTGDAAYRWHVRLLRIFYHELSLCVNLGNCDSYTACQYFSGRISNFMFYHGSYLEKNREPMIDDGNGTQITALYEKACAPLRSGIWWSNGALRYVYGYLLL